MENGESSAPSALDDASPFSCRRETKRRLEDALRARGYLAAYDDEEDDMYVYDKGDEDEGDGSGDWRGDPPLKSIFFRISPRPLKTCGSSANSPSISDRHPPVRCAAYPFAHAHPVCPSLSTDQPIDEK